MGGEGPSLWTPGRFPRNYQPTRGITCSPLFSDSHLDFELLHKFRPTGFEIGNRLIGFASLVCMGNTGESVIRETARIRFTSQISRCTIINIYMYQNFFMSTLIADVVKLPYQVQNSQNNKLQHSRPGHTKTFSTYKINFYYMSLVNWYYLF